MAVGADASVEQLPTPTVRHLHRHPHEPGQHVLATDREARERDPQLLQTEKLLVKKQEG